MAQAIAETAFDAFYLCFALFVGLTMLLRGNTPLVKKAGWMVTLLGAGDAFHLVPRAYALWTIGLEANAVALGIGKFITSITMTIFYLLLYYIWRERYQITGQKNLTITMWVLSALRIGLCLFPQNEWLVYQQPLLFGILRNLPFAVMGVLIIIIFAQQVKQTGDKVFRFLPAGRFMGQHGAHGRHVDDPQNTGLCVGSRDVLAALPPPRKSRADKKGDDVT